MEVDEAMDLTAKVFHQGVRSVHDISLSVTSPKVQELREAISKKLEFPLTKYTLGNYTLLQCKDGFLCSNEFLKLFKILYYVFVILFFSVNENKTMIIN